MKQFTYVITDPLGIHARPAGLLAKQAKSYAPTVVTISKGGQTVKAGQLMKLMSLGVKGGDEITVSAGGIDSEEPVILAADDLAPSETLQLGKSKILGFITQGGSGNSHTAILARTMGIPAICGLGDELEQSYEGRTAYIDGETGQVVLEPDELTLQSFQEKLTKQEQMRKLMQTMKDQEDVTLDGRHIKLYCNIGSPEDVSAVLANDGQGIGLFRSEFLYLAASDYPTEEEQFQAYKSVAEAMGIDELSVSPASVLPLRAAIRESDTRACTLELLEW
ncbi:MAG: HPr family phosphocarrier protein [Clostridiales bacterium]|nr:HPr family phosphocarrier protein [Clostridiales bacterium]